MVILPLLAGTIVVLVLATTSWGNERVRRVLVSQANDRLTGRMTVDRLRGNLLSGATLTGVRLVDSAGKPVFTARRVAVQYGLWSSLRGRVVVKSLMLDTALVIADRQPGARWNFQSLMRPRDSSTRSATRRVPPELADITVRHGRVVYRRPWQPDSALASDRRDAAIAAALRATARSRTERVPGGFQRVIEFRDVDARIPSVVLATEGRPTTVRIASLSMIGEPYRPPVLDVRSLSGTLHASKDSLWWQGLRLALPGSRISGDGRLDLDRPGMAVTLVAAPLALADLRWLNPTLPTVGGGSLRLTVRAHGDSSEYTLGDADIRYREASIVGNASLVRVAPKGRKSSTV
ncbi:MAG: hypothetical protein ABIV10_15600, partial [Gemmatimonadaceae bacterium]